MIVRAAAMLALCARLPLFAQAGTMHQRSPVYVPFVGCESGGQTDVLKAPKGTSKAVPISPKVAEMLAYFESADGIGLLAPRGWYCEGASGSSGYVLYLSPKPNDHDLSGWHGLEGPAIGVDHMSNENSGKWDIAEIMARVFPSYRAFATRFMKRMDVPIPSGPYPKDTLRYRSKTIVEYNTPAQTEGLGSFDSWLGKSDHPITGAAMIVGDPPNVRNGPDLVLLSVRFPPELAGLIPVIVGQFERNAAVATRK